MIYMFYTKNREHFQIITFLNFTYTPFLKYQFILYEVKYD